MKLRVACSVKYIQACGKCVGKESCEQGFGGDTWGKETTWETWEWMGILYWTGFSRNKIGACTGFIWLRRGTSGGTATCNYRIVSGDVLLRYQEAPAIWRRRKKLQFVWPEIRSKGLWEMCYTGVGYMLRNFMNS